MTVAKVAVGECLANWSVFSSATWGPPEICRISGRYSFNHGLSLLHTQRVLYFDVLCLLIALSSVVGFTYPSHGQELGYGDISDEESQSWVVRHSGHSGHSGARAQFPLERFGRRIVFRSSLHLEAFRSENLLEIPHSCKYRTNGACSFLKSRASSSSSSSSSSSWSESSQRAVARMPKSSLRLPTATRTKGSGALNSLIRWRRWHIAHASF